MSMDPRATHLLIEPITGRFDQGLDRGKTLGWNGTVWPIALVSDGDDLGRRVLGQSMSVPKIARWCHARATMIGPRIERWRDLVRKVG